MLKPPSLKSIPLYPVTVCAVALAVTVSAFWWFGRPIDEFFMDVRVWEHWELWRALTSTLPHVNLMHLAFNLYWLWVFGPVLERVYGHWRFAGIVLLLAFASSLAEFSLLFGGVGLSGVGYGLWGMLWVLERRDVRFAGTVDDKTSRMFVMWFFLCIVLTVTGIMPVANVAHGAGAIMGALLGLAAGSQGRLKALSVAGAVLVLLFGLAGSMFFWPQLSFSEHAESEVERAGLEAMTQKRGARAIELLEMSAHMRGAPARAWYNLGIAYQRIGKFEQALASYEQAVKLPGADNEMRRTAQQMKEYLARR